MTRSTSFLSDAPPLPFIDLDAQRQRLGEAIERAMARVIEHGRFILGPEVEVLESALQDFCGARHVVTCANGTDALVLALMAHGVGPGDAVFVPSFSFVAAAEAAALRGATPVFVDVDPETFNIDPASLERTIEAVEGQGIEARAIIAVDLFGHPADYPSLRRIADDWGLILIADAAQAFGAALDGRKVGTLANCTTTSFFPAKPLGCFGDGGAIATNDDTIASTLRSLRVHGRGTDKYDNDRVGLNSRLDTLQAAILLEKLRIFEDEIAARTAIARRYGELLGDIVRTPAMDQTVTPVWAQYTILLGPEHDRMQVQARCRAHGVPTMVYYAKPLHRQTAYAGCPGDPAGLAQSEALAGRVLSLPMHAYLDAATQDRVADTLRAALAP